MVKINVKVQGSEAIIKKFRDESIVKEPLADMVSEGIDILESETHKSAAKRTGRLSNAVTSKVESQFYGMVYMGEAIPYATFNAWGAPGHNFEARHSVGGQTIADGYGFVNYAFNTNIRRIYGIAYKKMLPEIVRRLRE